MESGRQEQIEKEAKEFLAQNFVRTLDIDVVEGEEKDGAGIYVHLQFDTLRNVNGEGDFRVSVVKSGDRWFIADYEALPMGGGDKVG